MESSNLYNLEDDILFQSNENFYTFVEQMTGEIEAEILRIQGIRNARCLIRSTNLLAILELDCDEINQLKSKACFKCKDGSLVIKQGIKLNLENLFDVLKEKHEKYKKKNRQQLLPSSPSTLLSTSINTDINDVSATQNSTTDIPTVNSLDTHLFTMNAIATNSSVSKYSTINDHVVFIKDLIEKFSRKTFTSVVLKQNEHYELMVTQDSSTFKATIKCQCGGKIFLPTRTNTGTFILSNFYAHLTMSPCSMVNRIIEEQNQTSIRETVTQSSSISLPQSPMAPLDSNTSHSKRKRKTYDILSETMPNHTNKKTKK